MDPSTKQTRVKDEPINTLTLMLQ